MTIEIKTATLEPVRHTFAHIARRFGDKPATRYQEASYDIQSEQYFHYRPLWQPDKELNDPSRTAIVMQDWYAFRDPRQYYYGTYVQQRAKLQEAAENNYAFFEKRGLAQRLDATLRDKLIRFLIPLRHVEHNANLSNLYACDYGYGTVLVQACLFNGMDRLGIAQYLSRIGLLLDDNSGTALVQAKQYWLTDPVWQPLRAYVERLTVVEDWFEVLIAQNWVLDSLLYQLFYQQFDAWLQDNGGQDIGMLIEFMQQWDKDSSRWMDAVVKTAASESAENQALLEQWVSHWHQQATTALQPLADELLGADALALAQAALNKRLSKAGLATQEVG